MRGSWVAVLQKESIGGQLLLCLGRGRRLLLTRVEDFGEYPCRVGLTSGGVLALAGSVAWIAKGNELGLRWRGSEEDSLVLTLQRSNLGLVKEFKDFL